MKKLLINIDCIIDVRLGALIKISSDFAFKVSSEKSYYDRVEDKFSAPGYGTLDKELFNSVKLNNLNEVLRLGLKTKIYRFVFELLNTISMVNIDGPKTALPELVINTYPYELNQYELLQIIKSVKYTLLDSFDVTAVCISDEDLTVDFVKENYFGLIMYDYTNWLEFHTESLKSGKLKNTALYVPRLFFIRDLDEKEKELFKGRTLDEFDILQLSLANFIQLQLCPMHLFCADTPMNK